MSAMVEEPVEDGDWEWFEEIDDFKHDLRYGWSPWPKDTLEDEFHEKAHDAMIFAFALGEMRGLGANDFERSRGPGRRARERYWDD